ncbi:hypothetical protein CI109_106053 [Kwoniella shandongensis]|uniref:Uncharacterized protein n=1 Tax=Kwoniella shandongensis TaxID=1734106 RepID=A0A5M6C208_9TREE|nr:uncharacterized protein CI109_003894 [Kwoniella shandongensis]KAA5527635.1 hypothetical protein CI109_003894 [Kwoniella shandongensis]
MKVFILGATGFIGLPVAEAFVRAGHIVYGSTRSESSAAKKLAPVEIIPVVCDPHSKEGLDKWGKIAADCDVVIDCLGATGPNDAVSAFKNFLSHVDRPKSSPKPTYIYTSGLWINARGMGGLDKWTDERQPTSTYLEAVQWRPLVEVPILESDRVHGIVIRAAVVYGKDGSLFGPYIFEPAHKASKTADKVFETFYKADTRVASIHTDDVADLYLRVAERAPICSGQVFLASNQATERLTDILDAAVRVSGCKGYKAKEPTDPWDKAWTSTVLIKPSLGNALTGWTPKKMSLVDGMDIYYAAWLANKELSK